MRRLKIDMHASAARARNLVIDCNIVRTQLQITTSTKEGHTFALYGVECAALSGFDIRRDTHAIHGLPFVLE